MTAVSIQIASKEQAWFDANPNKILLDGQVVFLKGTTSYKVGDGTTVLSALVFSTDYIDAQDTATLNAANTYADSLVTAIWKDQGEYDASGNTFPTAAHTTPLVANVLEGFLWRVSVPGVLGGVPVNIGDYVRALIDNPAQIAANWAIAEGNIGYVPENNANKNASGGYAGLDVFAIQIKNALGTITSKIASIASGIRTYTFPDKDITVAGLDDVALKLNISDFDDLDVLAYQYLGSNIKLEPLGYTAARLLANRTHADGQIMFVTTKKLTSEKLLSGVVWWQQTQGNYTADNYNGVGLFSINPTDGELNLVASSTNDGNIWKAASLTWNSKAFAVPYLAPPGVYVIAALYNISAVVTNPIIGGFSNVLNAGAVVLDFPHSIKTQAVLAAQAALPNSIMFSALSNVQQQVYLSCY